MIENVNPNVKEMIKIMFSNERNGGGPLSDNNFLQNNILILYFKNPIIAKNLLNRDSSVEYDGQIYKPKKVTLGQTEFSGKGT
jgi:hypothetical protein